LGPNHLGRRDLSQQQPMVGSWSKPPAVREVEILRDQEPLRESWRESDRSILDLRLLPAFGHKCVKDITARDIDTYKAAKMQAAHQYGKGYSPKSINNQIAVLHRMFEKAIEYRITT
jgi:hypothetical protein